jgi:hypothetical protein
MCFWPSFSIKCLYFKIEFVQPVNVYIYIYSFETFVLQREPQVLFAAKAFYFYIFFAKCTRWKYYMNVIHILRINARKLNQSKYQITRYWNLTQIDTRSNLNIISIEKFYNRLWYNPWWLNKPIKFQLLPLAINISKKIHWITNVFDLYYSPDTSILQWI